MGHACCMSAGTLQHPPGPPCSQAQRRNATVCTLPLPQADRELTNLIRRKFSIKCTTGYSLNALVDFPLDNPIEIIKRLMIGSEGTLGFVSQASAAPPRCAVPAN